MPDIMYSDYSGTQLPHNKASQDQLQVYDTA